MNKAKLLGLATILFSGSSFATTMSCYVDTPAYDQYSANFCFAVGQSRTTTASFKLTNTSGTIHKVLWSGTGTSSCSQSSTTCNVSIRHYQSVKVTADVLYTNGTWETSSATANYEGYF